MKKLFVLFILFAVCSNVTFAQGQAPASTSTTAPAKPQVHKAVKKEAPALTRSKEEIIDFIFAKSQKYNVHFAEYKRDIDTIFYNGKVKAQLNIAEIDTIVVGDANIKIYSKLGIQKYNFDKKRMQAYPDLELALETHDWNFYEENLHNRLINACTDYMRVLREEQEQRRRIGHDPSDPY